MHHTIKQKWEDQLIKPEMTINWVINYRLTSFGCNSGAKQKFN